MSEASTSPLDGRSRRYRRALLAAVPVGAVLGAAPSLGLAVEGAMAQQGPSPLYLLLLFSGAGAATAVLAALGASLATLIADRRNPSKRGVPYLAIGTRAGATVALSGLLLGAISATLTDSWDWYPLEAVIAFTAAAGSAAAATSVTALAVHRRPSARTSSHH